VAINLIGVGYQIDASPEQFDGSGEQFDRQTDQ
jgi:hypothetical protein